VCMIPEQMIYGFFGSDDGRASQETAYDKRVLVENTSKLSIPVKLSLDCAEE
jgi:hypothetical protein